MQSKKGDGTPQQNDLLIEMSNLNRRLRLSDERAANLRKKVQLLEQNLLAQGKKAMGDAKTALTELSDLSQKVSDMNDKIAEILSRFEEVAHKTDVLQIERYLSLWKPVNFVTQNEIDEIVDTKLKEHMKHKTAHHEH